MDDPLDPFMKWVEDHYHKIGEEPRWHYHLETEATILPPRELFDGAVMSTLPYMVSKLKGVWRYTGFMIDDQRLVGMKVCYSLRSELNDSAHLDLTGYHVLQCKCV